MTHRSFLPCSLLALVALSFLTPQPTHAHAPLPWLQARGTDLVDAAGRPVMLRGFNAGGAFLVELWLAAFDLEGRDAGLPEVRDEKSLWDALEQRFGRAKMEKLRRAWRAAWFNEADVGRLARLGCNAVRIPFWYRLLEEDEHPGELLPEGTQALDRILAACEREGVYAILDLHGAPGGQSKEDHTGERDRNEFFGSPALQARTARLWAAVARRYHDHPEVAGYDLLNEPTGAPDPAALIGVHDALYRAVRAADPRHVVIVEDGYKGWDALPDPQRFGWQNVCYSIHHYRFDAKSAADHARAIAEDLPRWRQRQQERGVPLYIGEFSTITEAQGGGRAMADYFAAFQRSGWSWTAWTYKQIDAVDGRKSLWGLYTNTTPWDRPNPYRDSFETLTAKFRNYDTGRLTLQGGYGEAVRGGCRG